MKVIDQSVQILGAPDYGAMLRLVEVAGRTCYKSEHKIARDSAEKFVKRLIKIGHLSVIEHAQITIRMICDRGISHELVRHRIGSYSQESTRYCNYENEIIFIKPLFREGSVEYFFWESVMMKAEGAYQSLIRFGAKPEEARDVLTNSLKTEVVVTYNIRQWRHFLKQRMAPGCHPKMRKLARLCLNDLKHSFPVFFEDIEVKK